MKSWCLLLFALPLLAAEPEGTAWYDAEGKLVLVEGPAAEPAEQPFIAESQRRDWERRERMNGRNWRDRQGYDWPAWGTSYPVRRSYYRGYGIRGGYRSYGSRYRSYRGYHGGYCGRAYGGGATLIIRW
ncbi:MAG: hypothetical protein AAGI48_09815 [Verrucomicrobiota bacterium]